jgi:Family of unknown function (DUF6064)
MPDWTYRLSDFLLFSPRTYYRMLERYNEELWPAHLLTLALGVLIAVLTLRARMPWSRIVWTILALLWLWIGWAFLRRRYGTINWAVVYLLPLFGLQALLLLRAGWVGKLSGFDITAAARRRMGLALFAASLVLYPAVASLVGRSWRQAEIFGMAPDPTAIATLGLVLQASSRIPWGLMIVPVVWCLVSGLTLWAMEAPEAWLPPAAALLSVLSIWLPRTDSGGLD